MEQELARPQGIVVEAVALIIGTDVHAQEEDFAVLDAAEAVLQIDLALAQGLDFRPRQGNAGFIRFMDKIIVTGLAVVRNIFHTLCR